MDVGDPAEPKPEDGGLLDTPEAETAAKASKARSCWFEGNPYAQGLAYCAVFRAGLIISNLFLLSSLLYLANEAAGCIDEDGEILENCEGRVYGQKPGSLIANIAVISGVMSALLMPLFGAILDYTSYRWITGVMASMTIVVIQAIQIGTVSSTWFPMAILEAFAGFLYMVLILATFAYQPDLARQVGEAKLTKFQGNFGSLQFGLEVVFLIVAVGLSILLKFNGGGEDNVRLAQVTQAMSVIWSIPTAILAWRLLPHVPASRTLPEKQRLWSAGFKENWQTTKRIYRDYRKSLFLFLVGTAFAEASAAAFTSVSVIYLREVIGLSSSQVGIFFIVALVAFVPGTQLASVVATKISPKNSLIINVTLLAIVSIVGAMTLGKGTVAGAYIWGCVVGILLGWFYPTEAIIFALCLPDGQDSELAGFFVYSSQIAVWLPPLIFSAIVNAGIDQNWGVVAVSVFGLIGVAFFCAMPPWEEVLAEVGKRNIDPTVENDCDVEK